IPSPLCLLEGLIGFRRRSAYNQCGYIAVMYGKDIAGGLIKRLCESLPLCACRWLVRLSGHAGEFSTLTTVRLDVRVVALDEGCTKPDGTLKLIGDRLDLFKGGIAHQGLTIALREQRDIIHLRDDGLCQSPPLSADLN